MFSALLNAQNRSSAPSIPITSVTWSIASNTNSAYNGTVQSVTVVSVTPAGATYSTNAGTTIFAGFSVSTTITGTGSYTGTFTSPTLTVVKATPSVGVATQGFPDDNEGFYYIYANIAPSLAQGIGIGYSDNFGGFLSDLTGSYVKVNGYDSVPANNTVFWSSNATTNYNATSGSVFLPPVF
jgi:hypothetical protein